MKSAASHFLNASYTRESTITRAANIKWEEEEGKKKSILPFSSINMDDIDLREKQTSLSRTIFVPRPVFLAPLLRASRVGDSAVLLDGFPCATVCFCGRVVRIEGPHCNKSASTVRPYTAILLSDNTGIIAVMQYHISKDMMSPLSLETDGVSEEAAFVSPIPSTMEAACTTTTTAAGGESFETDEIPIRENDYVFVLGRLAFPDNSKEVRRVVQGALEFVANDVLLNSDKCLCVRGSVRLINDMNEIHYWALSALETHKRLLSKKVL
ncbi:uncharacterized protein TM35_000231780 [Trypanosoma theileri]|uniref:Uncharacterized protein n=1 Tax=Trypanosoma theileri TaxID=67003 RepID=A0A1X0NR85_9TRYP|nr:uncharacterized protein TM35_000231780 [Trypanosoma theileri]ORC87207.1 hypothetical protein TM35_000231780 [Trypanosoma theileri]